MPNHLIDRIIVHWGHIPVNLLFSYGKVDRFAFTIVRIGAGEYEGVGESIVSPNDFLFSLPPTLIGQDPRRLDGLIPPAGPDRDRILCEAVSMALHDLVGKLSSQPLCVLLGGKQRDTVPLMPCIFPLNPEEAKVKAARFFSQGYRHLKTKLVGDLVEDTARIQAIRSVAPAGVVLQADANEGYVTLADARRAVTQLGEAGLDIFEDPLRGGVEDYARLRGGSGARIMVDVLARKTSDLRAVLRAGATDMVGLHPDQPGSLSCVLRHIALARSFDVPAVVGGTGYTGIGSAAYQHLTAALPDGPCGELGGHFDHGMPFSLVRHPLPMENGCVRIPDTPGSGIELHHENIARVQEGSKEWTK